MKKLFSVIFVIVLMPMVVFAQHTSLDSISMFHESTAMNSGKIQQEMIYLHLDNNSYYRGDRIFFACYLVTSGKLKPSDLSQTVYVELLNPSGKIIDRCVLRAVDGRCHGSLLADETPFYSGYYEIRAYTRYMLNFGPEAIFSRVIPIYASPQKEGDWADRRMLKYGSPKYVYSRPKPAKATSVNAKFYPEGGHMIKGTPATVAMELTNSESNPIQVSGVIVDVNADTIVSSFETGHIGRGTFCFIPQNEKYRADFKVNGKKYSVNLPSVDSQGISVHVDNLTSNNSVTISLTCSEDFPTKIVGTSLSCRGELYNRAIIDFSTEPSVSFKVSRKKLPTGVILLTVFDTEGEVLTDRLFFNNRNDLISIEYQLDKPYYAPFEPVNLDVKLSQALPFSLSVADTDNHIAYGSNILAELLLASEIKGYVHNPAYYFEDNREADLDNLLLIQGWRKYPWKQLAGLEPYQIDYMPEEGIEIHGRVLDRFKNNPKQDVIVSALFNKLGWRIREIMSNIHSQEYLTDSIGRFAFRTDFTGKQMLSLNTYKKDKPKKYRIYLDSKIQPEIRAYDLKELKYTPYVSSSSPSYLSMDITDDYDPATDPKNKNTRILNEVSVTAQRSHADDLRQYIENSTASYDINSERASLYDHGIKNIRKIKDILPLINPNFMRDTTAIVYRGRRPLYVIDKEMGKNGKMVRFLDLNSYDPSEISIDLVKSIHINEQPQAIAEYAEEYFVNRAELMNDADLMTDKNGVKKGGHTATAARDERNRDFHSMTYKLEAFNRFSCVILIELNSGFHDMIRPGARRAIIDGYTDAVEFYAPDYSTMPILETDYRRTLYWNPEVIPDENGIAHIKFYNNGTAKNFNVTATTLSPDGKLGALR